MATNNAINQATAASGKVLQGAGVGTNNAFSTATYPSTATTTGQVLRADGTNWVGTTATYPNTATTGDILYASGTNVIGSLADVATGQVLTSRGVGAIPAYSATPTVTSVTFGSGNALNTYVTNTWTPNLQINASSTGITYTTQLGGYTQIGNVVFYWIRMTLSSKGSSTGTVSISNFPVNGSTNGTNQATALANFDQFTFAGYTTVCLKSPSSGTSSGNFLCAGTGVSASPVSDARISNTFSFYVNGFYIVD